MYPHVICMLICSTVLKTNARIVQWWNRRGRKMLEELTAQLWRHSIKKDPRNMEVEHLPRIHLVEGFSKKTTYTVCLHSDGTDLCVIYSMVKKKNQINGHLRKGGTDNHRLVSLLFK